MHDTENFLDVLTVERVRLFCSQQYLIQLFQKGIRFIEVHIQHRFHAGFDFCHNNIPFLIYACAHIICLFE